jgi:hypothetical protein
MRWIIFAFALLLVPAAFAGEGKIIKVLPLYLDSKGRDSLLPSLYERDAYQAQLRKHADQRKTLRFAVQWKASNVDWSKTKLVVETRGVVGNALVTRKAERAVHKRGFFEKLKFENIDISGENFDTMGELAAWRVTFWEGNHKLAEEKSFLW